VTVDGLAVGSTVSVTATAEDDACLADGTPAHNVSAPCAAVSVEVRDAIAEVRADADAHGRQIEAVKRDIDAFRTNADATYSTKTEVDERTKAVTESTEAKYLKKDDASTTYATKTELSKSADGIRSEVSEEYVTKNDAAKAYAGKSTFEQLATSIKSLVKGESTYTDPSGKSATSGIYSLVTQTRDSVTVLFGDYTKTADLASTAAVKDAKKAGTDAQAAAAKTDASSAVTTANSASASAASAVKTANAASSTASSASNTANAAKTSAASAVSTANAAKSTADGAKSTASAASATASSAKSTADSLATLIRADSTGITIGKSADGKTWSTGRTHMDEDSFDVLDKAGKVITQLAADGVSFLAGLVRIVARNATLPGNKTVSSIAIDAGDGVAAMHGIISRLEATINGITSSVSAGWEGGFGYGVTAIARKSATVASAAYLAPDKAELHVGDNHVTMTGGSFDLSHAEYLLAALMDTKKVPGSLDTCGPGVFTYNTSTKGRPTGYGVCVSLTGDVGHWLFQVALPTEGNPLWRRNINGGGWSSWWTIKSQ
jgi:hypothetical protein